METTDGDMETQNRVATDLKELKKVLLCVVCSTPLQMNVVDLLRDYGDLQGQLLPIKEYGYSGFVDFLQKECLDVLKLEGNPQNPVLVPVITEDFASANDSIYFRNIPSTSLTQRRSRGINASTGQAYASAMIENLERHNVHLASAKSLRRHYTIMKGGPHGTTWKGFVPDSVLESPAPKKLKPKLIVGVEKSQRCPMCNLTN